MKTATKKFINDNTQQIIRFVRVALVAFVLSGAPLIGNALSGEPLDKRALYAAAIAAFEVAYRKFFPVISTTKGQ